MHVKIQFNNVFTIHPIGNNRSFNIILTIFKIPELEILTKFNKGYLRFRENPPKHRMHFPFKIRSRNSLSYTRLKKKQPKKPNK